MAKGRLLKQPELSRKGRPVEKLDGEGSRLSSRALGDYSEPQGVPRGGRRGLS